MSATEDLDIIYRCLKLGADDYIFKPVRSELLKNLWANLSRKRRENSIFRLLDSERSKSSNMNQHVREMQAEIAQLKEQVNEAIETPLQIISREIKVRAGTFFFVRLIVQNRTLFTQIKSHQR